MSARAFCFVVAAACVAASLVAAAVPLSLTLCQGINCARGKGQCQTQNLTTGKCYTDRATGRAVRFLCLRNASWTCFDAIGSTSPICHNGQTSRNSLTCNSCTGDVMFKCNKFERSVVVYSGCSNCGNCSRSTRYPIGKCLYDSVTKNFSQVTQLIPCGLTVIQQLYQGSTCTGGSYQVGVPSKFCGASATASRLFTCGGVDEASMVGDGTPVGEIEL